MDTKHVRTQSLLVTWSESNALVRIAVAAGGHHTCALLDGGDVRCWGGGAQLGIGATEALGDDEGEVPTENVPLGEPAPQLAAGTGHICALLESGAVRCWGSELPRENVELGGQAVGLSAGGAAATCAILADGRLQCWGYNAQGALGIGNPDFVGDDETPADAGQSLVF